ncbi:hypothetical protein tinsulaeT_32380 [Thalassotalea insulae]|uniref:Uncharacterized protein n=1 Tax=Thalassotalea insulae TaxID=2056778 RepID=A0ABQ6GVD5_9GAMM|nr:hypothetical protein [Thalassotalea insulae]GLX79898.1 hypothetical protein tinsulaeT_32380 [Thalassotalea insulae]
MSFYNIFGGINTFCIFLSLLGVYAQLRTVLERKKQREKLQQTLKESVTTQLSLNQFSVSFLAYFSFFVYGYSIAPFNHYIVWPRLIAALLVAMILYQIWHDRKNKASLAVILISFLFLILGSIGLAFGERYIDQGRLISTFLILLISLLIAQGYYHQISLIVRSGVTGAVNLKMSQFIFVMDLSTIAFALSMGLDNGWPLMVLAVTSGITKVIMMYLFYWVKHSPLAKQRALIWQEG